MSSTSIKAIDQTLEGVGIIEKDDHNDIIMTWYVAMKPENRLGNRSDLAIFFLGAIPSSNPLESHKSPSTALVSNNLHKVCNSPSPNSAPLGYIFFLLPTRNRRPLSLESPPFASSSLLNHSILKNTQLSPRFSSKTTTHTAPRSKFWKPGSPPSVALPSTTTILFPSLNHKLCSQQTSKVGILSLFASTEGCFTHLKFLEPSKLSYDSCTN